jgi:carbonic anhydrase
MAAESYEETIATLTRLLQEKAELGGIAAVKIKELTAELQAKDSKPFNPDERIRSGFVHFKTEKFEYVFAFTVVFRN